MIIAEMSRNTNFVSSLTPYAPFIWTGYTNNYEYSDTWGTTLGDVLLNTGRLQKVIQVTRDFVNKYIKADTYNDCVSQVMSYYFDEALQQVYIHTEYDFNPIVSSYDYGFAFGMCSESFGVMYIDDYEYLPLVKSIPTIEQESDVVGLSEPTGMTGSITLNNVSCVDPIDFTVRGELDFLIDEAIFGNDILLYDYRDEILTPIACFYIDDFELSLSEAVINLQDKRFA
jgi:hypothetical protein